MDGEEDEDAASLVDAVDDPKSAGARARAKQRRRLADGVEAALPMLSCAAAMLTLEEKPRPAAGRGEASASGPDAAARLWEALNQPKYVRKMAPVSERRRVRRAPPKGAAAKLERGSELMSGPAESSLDAGFDVTTVMMVTCNIGRVLQKSGDHAGALEHLQEAQFLAREVHDDRLADVCQELLDKLPLEA